jgi:3-hydroxyisobutyrate dehydrogenase
MDGHWERIGMIGVGLMGHGIAANLLKHAHPLTLLDHSGNRAVDDLVAAGARRTTSCAALAGDSEVIVLCVTGSPAVEDVMLRADGIVAALRPGQCVIDCTTAEPSSTLRVAAKVQAAGAHYLDAAMTRTAKEAEAGRLGLIVGGDRADFERLEPLLRRFGESIVHAGPVGNGHRLKLLHNFVSLGFAAVLAEAAVCAGRAGVDPGAFIAVLKAGAGDGVVFRRMQPFIEARDDSGLHFTIVNAIKDIGYYGRMAGPMASRRPCSPATRRPCGTATARATCRG